MTLPETPLPAPDVPPPASARPRWRVPATAWAWLLIFAVLTVFDARGERRPAARAAEPITSLTFEAYVEAETATRQAFGIRAAAGGLDGATIVGDKAFDEAIKAYRDVLQSGTPAPGAARRLLIVAHAAGRPFDGRVVDETLPRALQAAGTNAKEIRAETALWRALYAAVPPLPRGNGNRRDAAARRIAAADVAAYSKRIRALRLRFLEDRALADLYQAAGETRQARAAADRFARRAGTFQFRLLVIGALGLVTFVAGLVFLGIFAWTALGDKRWTRVARVPTQPQRLAWGDLLDAFVFYLAFYKGVGLLVGLALPLLVPVRAKMGPETAVALNAALQFGTGIAAVAYLARAGRRRGVPLADVGLALRPGRLAGDLAYGVAGYAAALPLLFMLGKVSEMIFQHFPNATPNPALTLLTSADGWAARALIFLMVAGGAPFFEELFFRGALFTGLRTRWGWGICAVICALAFALVHPPVNWLPIFGLGYVLCAMREMRQSLVPCFVAHFLQNAVVFVFLSLLFR